MGFKIRAQGRGKHEERADCDRCPCTYEGYMSGTPCYHGCWPEYHNADTYPRLQQIRISDIASHDSVSHERVSENVEKRPDSLSHPSLPHPIVEERAVTDE